MRIGATTLCLLALLCACSGGGAGEDNGDGITLVIAPTTLPLGTRGVAYSAAINVTGGSGAGYTWTLDSGTLPPGVAGLPGMGNSITLSGTPSAAMVAAFTVAVTDSDGTTTTRRFTLTVQAGSGGSSTATSLARAPSPRAQHTAVWTGSEMIVWGGLDTTNVKNDGAAYDPTTDTWRALPMTQAPMPRFGHTVVWTGTEMIVWGGTDFAGPRNDGGAYDPRLDRWRPLSVASAPAIRSWHTAVWTGTRMIVWGGQGVFPPPAPNSVDRVHRDGGSYDPVNDLWAPIATTGPAVRGHTAIWTGSRMIAWGGHDSFALTLNTVNFGGLYDPGANVWANVSNIAPPTARTAHTAVWDGFEMVVWGGRGSTVASLGSGKRYAPAADRWSTMSSSGAPAGRHGHTAIWTGNQMIVWGGVDAAGTLFGNGGTYAPGTDRWAPLPALFAPTARTDHSAVWTGTEMIIWGGRGNPTITYVNTGARLKP